MKKVYFWSGLSECGKSQAGQWATQNGIFRLKIIYFEKMIGLSQGIEMRNPEETQKGLTKLYQNEEKMIQTFKDKVNEFMVCNKCDAISLESLYRANLAKAFLEDPRFKTQVVYLEADFEKRAQREYQKLKQSQKQIAWTTVLEQIKRKDQFKIEKGVLEVKKIASTVIENNSSLKEYQEKIEELFQN